MSEPNKITLNHGAGGRMMQNLISDLILNKLSNPVLDLLDDCGVIDASPGRLAMTSDSYVVHPLSFPGGDIGKLAVCGTLNDLCTSGAIPKGLSLSLILEDGLSINVLEQVLESIASECKEAGVPVLTGDTKVVEKGKGDGIYINTAAVGHIPSGLSLSSHNAKPGDVVYITGTVGEHEISLMKARGLIDLKIDVQSDVKYLGAELRGLLLATDQIKAVKDPTRGGVAGVLNEIASHSNCQIEVDEESIPLRPQVAGTCKLLGLDPLYLANEGKYVIVAGEAIDEIMREFFPEASRLGEVVPASSSPKVLLRTRSGGLRRVSLLETSQLPRIC